MATFIADLSTAITERDRRESSVAIDRPCVMVGESAMI